jgi:hypothetical protein
MDQASRAMLVEILAKEPAALTEDDKGFLRARRSYLSTEQQAVYAEVLGEQPQAVEQEASEEAEAEKPKSRRSR